LAAFVQAQNPDDKTAIERVLSNAAELSPTSASGWQELAEVRLSNGGPFDNVLAAFRMSDLTGSHEGAVMVRRAIFGLQQWLRLPAGDRRIVIRDLVATMDPTTKQQYLDVLEKLRDIERDDIRAALVGSGYATPPMLQALGL
jgi:hypothetical protein